jgi:serine/threonine protein kinase
MDDLDLGATIKGFAPGQKVFGRYTLARVLGRGGMGVVWLARDEELGREVAMKFLPEVVAGDRAAIDEMKREVRRAIDLAHPHIVKTNDFVTDGRLAAVSMEYAPGGTVGGARLDQPGQVFSVAQLEPWVRQLASALDYAHSHAEVVHRDLKPNNLMLDAKGRLKVVDFGIAASISDSVSRVSKQAGTSGTPVYMSPQQMMGETPAPTDDLYAVGATLFELLTGKPPFHAGNILLQVQNKPAPPVNERRRALGLEPVPEAWEAGIAACLAKDPSARPQSGSDLLAALGLVGPVVAPARPATPAPEPVPPSSPVPPVRPAAAVATRPSSVAWATKAAGFVAVTIFLLGVAFLVSEGNESDLGKIVGSSLLTGLALAALAWLPLLVVHRIVVPATVEDPELRAARLQARREKRRAAARKAFAALVASAGPFLLLAGWVWSRSAEYVIPGEEPVLLLALLVGWVFASGFYLVIQQVVFPGGPRPFGLALGVMAGVGVIFGTLGWGAGLALPMDLTLTGGDLARGLLASATLWAVAGLVSYRILQGPPDVPRPVLQLGGAFGAVLLVHALYFALVGLPEIIGAEDARRAEARAQEAERVRIEEERQAAARREEARGRVRDAYRQVFERAPADATEREFADRAINASWSDADLRRALRDSPEGRQGGRLLVPQEFARISEAVAAAVPGNVVVVSPGTYAETVVVDKDVDLIGPGGGRAVIQAAHDRNVLRISKAKGVVVRGLTFRHTGTADDERRNWLVSIRDSEATFEDNEVTAGNGDGIGVGGPGRVVVRNNRIQSNRWSGLSVWKDAEVEVLGNQIRANGQSGVSVREPVKSALVRGNTIAANQGAAINLAEPARVVLEGNELRRYAPTTSAVWWNTQKGAPRFGGGNTVDGQPLRIDAPN